MDTKSEITQADYDLLLASCNDAKYPGACKYVVGAKPACVVAQYAFRKGVPIEELASWDTALYKYTGKDGMNVGALFEDEVPGTELIRGDAAFNYNLRQLQSLWDNPIFADTDEEEARSALKKRLEKLFEVAPL